MIVNLGTVDGKAVRKSVTADTKAEAEFKAAKYKHEHEGAKKAAPAMTVRAAIERYIELSDVLSPTTIGGYNKILRTGFQDLLGKRIDKLTDEICQEAVNNELKRPSRRGGTVSAKTIINEWGLISSAIKAVSGQRFEVRLPKRMPKSKIYPDVQTVIEAIKGSPVELPCMLALWLSFSMSEIRGLRFSDIHDGIITINRVIVDVDGVPTVKENAKVETRLRSHVLPDYIMKLIEKLPGYDDYNRHGEDGYLVTLRCDSIRKGFQRLIKKNGYDLTFHDLRHLNASVMLALGVPDKYAMERGGWKTTHVMKTVYQHTFSTERQAIDERINSYFEDQLLK